MMHPDTTIRYINNEIGHGVVATKFIPKGTITWVQDELDQKFSPGEVESMQAVMRDMMDKYAFRDHTGQFILCWDLAKFVNHSFRANCLSTPYDFELAIRDIAPGEQLTDDYGYLNVSEPFAAVDEGSSRKMVYPDDLLRYHEDWDRQLAEAFPLFFEVDQPLKGLIPSLTLSRIEQKLRMDQPLDSILNLYCGEIPSELYGRIGD